MSENWGELHRRFSALAEKTGVSKGYSYALKVTFWHIADEFDRPAHTEISVELGGYDVGNWHRHENVGQFDSEEEALSVTREKIAEAEIIVAAEEAKAKR